MALDIARFRSQLNTSGLSKSQPHLYQVLNNLIYAAETNQNAVVISSNNLASQLLNSLTFGTSTDRPNYKPPSTAGNLVFFFEIDTQSLWVFADTAWYNVTGDLLATYLTATDESATLVNSRQLLAGTNVTFNDSVPNKRTINVSAGSPGGVDKQVQYNNAGAFGGISNGTAGYVLVSNGAAAVPSFQPVGAAGGNSISSTNYGSEPASPATGDVDLYDNSFYQSRYNGTIWELWGPIFKLEPPDDSLYSWVNQGGASVNAANGGIYLDAPAAVNPNYRMRVYNAPATPYTITAFVKVNFGQQAFGTAGICFYDTANPVVGFGFDSSGQLIVQQMNNPTSFNSTPTQRDSFRLGMTGNGCWLRMTDDGTNLIFYYSNDGQNYRLFRTQTRASFMTPNQVGFFASANDATYGSSILLLSWLQS